MIIELLDDFYKSNEIKFLFLGLNNKLALNNLKINFEALFYSPLDKSHRLNKFFKRTTLQELLLSCDGSDPLNSYLDLNTRYCDISFINNDEELFFRKRCGSSILSYANNFVFSIDENESVLRALIYILHQNFFEEPEKKWLKLFESIETINESFEKSYIPIAKKFGISINKINSFCKSKSKLNWLKYCGERKWVELSLVNSSNLEIFFSFFFMFIRRIYKKLKKTKFGIDIKK